MPELHFGPCGA
uniref:Uncharacterized protein n=1 Tax=Arundo donax TaxID=35708 RepID=A0A0A8Y4K1_ARUDO